MTTLNVVAVCNDEIHVVYYLLRIEAIVSDTMGETTITALLLLSLPLPSFTSNTNAVLMIRFLLYSDTMSDHD